MKIVRSLFIIGNFLDTLFNSVDEIEIQKQSSGIIALKVFAILFLLLMSAIFTGLNLGLIALDKTRMQILSDLGNETDKKRVKNMRVRKHGNALLCTLLIGDMASDILISLILNTMNSPIVTFFISTFILVIFGEIIPEAICSRYGLAVGAALWWVVFIFMIILAPLVFPMGWMLDCILGEELGNTYDRKQLKKLIEIHTKEDIMKQYGKDRINKIDFILLNDAFDFRSKKAQQFMTKMEDVFMLDVYNRHSKPISD
ncbi:MAG: putative cNMP binding protein [Streblomastix strix]|uniref:Putative cNMP binding protein n=1 Tax=Streblomastix strix TaxID=222440 RepID=A0A5J4VHK0_9EUKA|nr:MAG: putative cNMP binding protein [Streblomastix strix]